MVKNSSPNTQSLEQKVQQDNSTPAEPSNHDIAGETDSVPNVIENLIANTDDVIGRLALSSITISYLLENKQNLNNEFTAYLSNHLNYERVKSERSFAENILIQSKDELLGLQKLEIERELFAQLVMESVSTKYDAHSKDIGRIIENIQSLKNENAKSIADIREDLIDLIKRATSPVTQLVVAIFGGVGFAVLIALVRAYIPSQGIDFGNNSTAGNTNPSEHHNLALQPTFLYASIIFLIIACVILAFIAVRFNQKKSEKK